MSIGTVAKKTGLSADTLRYYEKIDLLPRVARDSGGRRRYDATDVSRLQFIQRAQRCNFTLREIGQLLKLRSAEQADRVQVQQLTEEKLQSINAQLGDLQRLKKELELLLSLCHGSDQGCPIIEGLGTATTDADQQS